MENMSYYKTFYQTFYQTFDNLIGIVQKRFPLSEGVCVPGSNYDFDHNVMPYLGHHHYLTQLESELLNNDSGAFLITGFRGVGKSVLVKSTLQSLSAKSPAPVIVLNINLSVQREYIDVLFEISRKLYNEVKKSNIWSRLPRNVRNRIELINQRTIMGIQYTYERSSEIGGTISTKNDPETLSIGLSPKISRKFSEVNQMRELTVSDIESEFKAIVEQIKALEPQSKIIIIIDEIDKLTQDDAGTKCFENFLGRSKSIISDTRTLFVFIAGVDVYEKWKEDCSRIDSLYDSLFTWQVYLPCVWDSVTALFDLFQDKQLVFRPINKEVQKLVGNNTAKVLQIPFQVIDQYLIFKGKGMLRKITKLFFNFVERNNKSAYFVLKSIDLQEVCYIKALYQIFYSYQNRSSFQSDFDRDAHFVVFLDILDYLISLKNKDVEFTQEQIIKALLVENELRKTQLVSVCDELLNMLSSDKDDNDKILKKIGVKGHTSSSTGEQKYIIKNLTIFNYKKRKMPDTKSRFIHDGLSQSDVVNSINNTITDVGIPAVEQYWENFTVKKIISISPETSISVSKKQNNKIYLATIFRITDKYEREKNPVGEGERFTNWKMESSIFPETQCIWVDNNLFLVIQEPINGVLLSELVSARLKRKVIFRIVDQVFAFALEMKSKSFLSLPITPNEIMICEEGLVKLIRPGIILSPKTSNSRMNRSVFIAPEETPDVDGKTLVYSIGMLLLFLVSENILDSTSRADDINTSSVLEISNCSNRLKKLISSMIRFDAGDRPELNEKLWERIKGSPDFWMYSFRNHLIFPSQTAEFRYYYSDQRNTTSSTTILPKGQDPSVTVQIGGTTLYDLVPQNTVEELPDQVTEKDNANFENRDNMVRIKVKPAERVQHEIAYLENLRTNAIIPIHTSPFTIGRSTSNSYIVQDRTVSKNHLKITHDEGQYRLFSNGTNGIIINGKRETEVDGIPLENDTTIQIGNTTLVFKCEPNHINVGEKQMSSFLEKTGTS